MLTNFVQLASCVSAKRSFDHNHSSKSEYMPEVNVIQAYGRHNHQGYWNSTSPLYKQLYLNDKIPTSTVSASQKYDTKVSEGNELKTDTIPLSLAQLSLNGTVATPPITKSKIVTSPVNANASNVRHSWPVISKSAESNNDHLKVKVGITNLTTTGGNVRAIKTNQMNSSNMGFGNFKPQNNVETRKLEAIIPLHRKTNNLAQAFAQSCKKTHCLLPT